ncbi:MAG: hypothetical protein M3Q30_13165 [Actinomycetota bacterium]|nr:hypothetical protein [Actinomycetota bacterium]
MRGYERIWRTHLRRALRRQRLSDITPEMLERLYARQVDDRGQMQPAFTGAELRHVRGSQAVRAGPG